MAKQKNQQSGQNSGMGTMTAQFDANGDYSQSTQTQNTKQKRQQSKQEYGTLTAKADANKDYQ